MDQNILQTKAQLVEQWQALHVDTRILDAFNKVPREQFIPENLRELAYHDQPLPTLREQSISQPTTIIMMLEALELKPGQNVFEVGAGSGYQAALISHIIGPSGHLTTVDIIPELVQLATQNIASLNLTNVTVLEMNGGEGYAEKAPYDRIMITCACPTIPKPLIKQLKQGGIIIAPVGDPETQTLVKGTKSGEKLYLEFLGQFRFVPMKGRHGFHGFKDKGLS